MNLVHFLAKIWLCGGVGKLFFSSLESYFFCYSTRTVLQQTKEIALMGADFILGIIPHMRSLRIT